MAINKWESCGFKIYADVLEKACFQFIHGANDHAQPKVCRLIRLRTRELNREKLMILVGDLTKNVWGLDV